MENILNEEMEVIEFMWQNCLFTNARVNQADVDQYGLHVCHLRSSDERDFATLEKEVLVDHSGSIISKYAFDLGNDEVVELTDDTSPNFIGETSTIKEFFGIQVAGA